MKNVLARLTATRAHDPDAVKRRQAPRLLTINLAWTAFLMLAALLVLYRMIDAQRLDAVSPLLAVTIVLALGVIALHTIMFWRFLSGTDGTDRQHSQVDHLLERASDISQTLSSLATDEDQLVAAVQQIRDVLGLYHVQVFMADPTIGMAVLRASTGVAGHGLLDENDLLADDNSPINAALRQTQPVVITGSAPEDQRTGFLPGTHSELLVPLRVSDLVPIGVLDAHSTRHDTFSGAVSHVLVTLGSQMAAALHSLHQMRDLRAGYDERDALITQLEAARRDLERANRQLVSATWGSYLDEHPDAVQGFDWQSGTILPPRSSSPVMASTIRDGEPHLDRVDAMAVLSVPIRLRGQTLGAVEFRRTSSAEWPASAQEMAQAVAERLALSLENARLFEQTQAAAHREQLVSQITSQLQTTNDLQTLLTLAAARFQQALGATHTQVRLGLPADSADGPAQE